MSVLLPQRLLCNVGLDGATRHAQLRNGLAQFPLVYRAYAVIDAARRVVVAAAIRILFRPTGREGESVTVMTARRHTRRRRPRSRAIGHGHRRVGGQDGVILDDHLGRHAVRGQRHSAEATAVTVPTTHQPIHADVVVTVAVTAAPTMPIGAAHAVLIVRNAGSVYSNGWGVDITTTAAVVPAATMVHDRITASLVVAVCS